MPGKHSLQGIPRPDRILYYNGQSPVPATISSTGYYHACCDHPPVEMEVIDLQRAFAIANQFNGFAEPSPHRSAYNPPCCTVRESYFEYQGVRLPVNFVPQLEEIFMKYCP